MIYVRRIHKASKAAVFILRPHPCRLSYGQNGKRYSEGLSEMIAWSIVDLFWALSYIIGVMVVLLSLNWRLALLVLVVVPPLALFMLNFSKKDT